MFDQDDLKFAITPEVDISAIEKYLSGVEEKATNAGKRAAASLAEGLSIPDLAKQNVELDKTGKMLEHNLKWLKDQLAPTEQLQHAQQLITDNARQQLQVQTQLQQAVGDRPEVVRAEAIAATTEELLKQQAILQRMQALSDPKHVAERLEMEKQITAVKEQQQRLKNAAGPVLELPTALDARAETMKTVTTELTKQRQELEKQKLLLEPEVRTKQLEHDKHAAAVEHITKITQLNEQSDPVRITEQLLREEQLSELDKKRAETAKKIKEELAGGYKASIIKQFTDELQKQTEELKKQKTLLDPTVLKQRLALEKESAAIAHQRYIAELKSQLDPKNLKESVAQQLEIEKLKEQLNKATDKERHEQKRPGFFQQLFQDPIGAFKNIGKKVGNFVGEQKEELSKGGIGGLLDKIFASGKGGEKQSISNVLLGGIMGGQQQSSAGQLGTIGGMLGEALGGPAGAEVGSMLGQAISKSLNAPASAAVGALNLVGDSLKGMSEPLGPIAVGFNLASSAAKGVVSAVSAISPILGEMIGPLATIPDIFKGITETLVSFAAKASPGQIKLFEMAVDDAQAVIGHSFLPVLELMKEGVRLAGDALANFLPNSSEMREALTEVRESLQTVYQEIRASLGELGPQIRQQLLGVISSAGKMLGELAKSASGLVKPLTELGMIWKETRDMMTDLGIDPLKIAFEIFNAAIKNTAMLLNFVKNNLENMLVPLRALGLIRPRASGEDPRSSAGAAARPAQFNSIEGYQQQLQQAAYSSGTQSPELQVANNQLTALNDIRDLLRNLDPRVAGQLMADAFLARFPGVNGSVPALVDQVVNEAGNFLNNIPGINQLFGTPGGS